ncbi:hypothetical protein HOE67_01490 [Candidatus Peregrinibacteria bacterium]|jgi:hypothetical protein|nr:hypothetical protein [Candidatus Peregrinibacteria bacterium]MBT4055760.1 hypothetical protein [Candidatus Peregrinibacteria bacterium]
MKFPSFFKKKTPISVDTPIEDLLDGKHDLSTSPFNDPNIPWFRRWYMFAFVYPTIISVILRIVLG